MSAAAILQLHHIHEHGLVLQELSELCITSQCSMCLSSVKGGPAYHCPHCTDFFLHIGCAEVPSTIQQHPFHPQHQLELIIGNDAVDGTYDCRRCPLTRYGDRYHYRCDECKIALHVGCAAKTLPTHKHEDKEAVKTIHHIAHEHPLESFYVYSPYSSCYCSGCDIKISGRAYGCRACIFVLHELCALAPREIESHPLHPQHHLTLVVDFEEELKCGACRNDSTRLVYHCNECDFNLDIRCALNVERHPISIPQNDNNSEKDRSQEICPFSCPHPMTYCYTKGDTGVACDFCKDEITGDFFVCGDCSFMFHKSCAELPQDMVHPLHPHHHLILQTADSRDCTLCWDDQKFLYLCKECDFGLHTQCALQSLSASEGELAINIKHIHEHPLRLQVKTDISCDVCQEAADGLVYSCAECPIFIIHRSCYEGARESQHLIHPPHPLILLSQPFDESSECYACLDSCFGFTFYCDYCKFHFHPRCVMKKPGLKHERHEHSLTYFSQIKSKSVQCNLCYEDCRVDFYRCVPCNYNLHYGCMPLPPSIKHEWHIHPMELRSKYINDTFDDQYCDLCETLRHPEHGVYVCEECRCAVHIDCVFPKVDLEKRRRMKDLKIKKLGAKISDLEMEIKGMRVNVEKLEKILEELRAEEQELVMETDE